MTYPQNSSGYPPSQQPTTQFSAPTQQFGKVEQPSAQAHAPAATAAAAGPNKLPFILLAATAVLGLLVYLFSFGDVFTIESTDFPQMGSATGTSQGVVMAVVAALVAGLIAATSLLPKQKAPIGVIAAVAVLAFLLTLAEIIQKPEGVSIGWALYAVIVLTFLQSAVAIGALLLDAGILKAPVPKPKHEQQPNYGPYGQPNQYYGQQRTASGRPAARALPGPVRRRILRWLAGGWRLRRRDRPAGRPADPSDRFPDLQPAAGVTVGSERPGVRATAVAAAVVVIGFVVVFVEPVRQLDVVIFSLASVNAAHASKELLYR